MDEFTRNFRNYMAQYQPNDDIRRTSEFISGLRGNADTANVANMALMGAAGGAMMNVLPNPVFATAMLPFAGTVGAAGALGLRNQEENLTDDLRYFKAKNAEERLKDFTAYKNQAIGDLYGDASAVSNLASQGKMVTDDGSIVDIDYDYYSQFDDDTLDRVFGTSGGRAVRKEITRRRGY